MVDIMWAVIFAILAAPLGHWAVINRHDLKLSLRCLFFLRKQRIRISYAALLRIEYAGQYLLVAGRLRKGSFGPLGGAYKYFREAQTDLDHIAFEPQVLSQIAGPGIEFDLRGFLRGRSVPKFMAWFRGGTGRENDSECLKRELREELGGAGLTEFVADVEDLTFTLVR
jgi:hypothetical protein